MTGEQADPADIQTRDEFGRALRERLDMKSLRSIESELLEQNASDRLRQTERRQTRPLSDTTSKTTLSEVFTGKRIPSNALLRSLLRLVNADDEYPHWAAALRRAAENPTASQRIQVAAIDPRLLGIHKSIQDADTSSEYPAYVERDTDTAARGVRSIMASCIAKGGFLLLVGDSSVGKTRTAYEAIAALLPDWWFVHPIPLSDNIRTLANEVERKTVIRLDELQRYLDGPNGLTADTLREIMRRGPVILVGTIWPTRFANYTTLPRANSMDDTYHSERELLNLAEIVQIKTEWSGDELQRAEAIANRDRRLAQALHQTYGPLSPPQILAAAPQLEQRWHNADPYSAAVLSAAIDATRLGYRSPLPSPLLQAAAPGYCDSRSRANAPSNWFENAIAYATETLNGAASALHPIAGPDMGETMGYYVADYLLQYVSPIRHRQAVPATLWDSLLVHTSEREDSRRLAIRAAQRLHFRHAVALSSYARFTNRYRRGLPTRTEYTLPPGVARLLAEFQDIALDANQVNDQEESLWVPANADNTSFMDATKKAELRTAIEVLGPLAREGDEAAAQHLAGRLKRNGDLAAAIEILRPFASQAGGSSRQQLARLLERRGDIQSLKAWASTGDTYAALRLSKTLAKNGDTDGAIETIERFIDAGHAPIDAQYSRLLAQRGDIEALSQRAHEGDVFSARSLSTLLDRQGQTERAVEVLRPFTRKGTSSLDHRLAALLLKTGATEEAAGVLTLLADNGDSTAADQLASIFIREHKPGLAISLLRPFADRGNRRAAQRLAAILVSQDDITQLEWRADNGDECAAKRLSLLLAKQRRIDKLRDRAKSGDGYAERKLAFLLAQREDLTELSALAGSGSRTATRRLAEAYNRRGNVDKALPQLIMLADSGDNDAAARLSALLAQQGRINELLDEVRIGNSHHAAETWLSVMYDSGDSSDRRRARDVRRSGLEPPAFASPF